VSNILGFDQSYTSSGYCVTNGDGIVLDFGTFKSDKTLDVYDRAIQVASYIKAKALEYNVDVINLEGLAFGIRGDATRDLAGLLFVIITSLRNELLTKNKKCSVIAPTSLKKFATGSGKADKSAMILAVPSDILERILDKKFKKTTGLADICDAYWLSKYK
jgi:Holliday junction resolvasome RuvABC endonuclease subunit